MSNNKSARYQWVEPTRLEREGMTTTLMLNSTLNSIKQSKRLYPVAYQG